MAGLGYKKCWQCGAENADDRQYCGVCGENLDSKELIVDLNKRLKEAQLLIYQLQQEKKNVSDS